MIYLDNAATTIKKPDAVYDAVLDAMKHCGNSGRGVSDASLDASRKIYEARMCLTEFFGGDDAARLVFTANATEALNIVVLNTVIIFNNNNCVKKLVLTVRHNLGNNA